MRTATIRAADHGEELPADFFSQYFRNRMLATFKRGESRTYYFYADSITVNRLRTIQRHTARFRIEYSRCVTEGEVTITRIL